MRRMLERVLDRVRRLDAVRRLARSGEYLRLRDVFIGNGAGSKIRSSARSEVVRQFEEVDANVEIASTPVEGLILAEILMSVVCEGDVVECGCFAGGSSAKLSIVAKLTNRRLHIYDSFEGLPEVDDYNLRDCHARRNSSWMTPWKAGRYASRLDEVQEHVRRFGNIDVCTWTKGWFRDTLTAEDLPSQLAMAFVDVDIASSARDCLMSLRPRLHKKGVYVSHDVAFIKVMQGFYDPDLWANVLKSAPPVVFGAGFGMGDLAPHVGFAVKGEVSADYIKSLTLEK